jgi:hypothetical protein
MPKPDRTTYFLGPASLAASRSTCAGPAQRGGDRLQPHGGGHRLRRGALRAPELRGRRLRRLPVHLCGANAVIANAAWCDSTGVNNEVRLYTKAYTRCVDAPEYYARTRMGPRVPSWIPGRRRFGESRRKFETRYCGEIYAAESGYSENTGRGAM